jgi:hypothetical protein
VLRDEAAERGLTLVAGEAENLLADRVAAVAGTLRVTERTALDTYLTEENVAGIATTLATQAASYRSAVQATEPISLSVAETGRVIAALGMAIKLAAEHAEATGADASGVAHDGADAVVGIGAVIAKAGRAPRVEVGGQMLVWTRGVLVRTIELLRAGRWRCPCRTPHPPGERCVLTTLIGDLNLVGGWLVDEDEPSADRR